MARKLLMFLLFMALTLQAACIPGGQQKSGEGKPATSAPPIPTVTVTSVVSQELSRQLKLPGELLAYQDVMLYPKVQGFIEWIGVDRGSAVRAGQLLVRLSAPEINSQKREADAKAGAAQAYKLQAESQVSVARAQRVEAEARLAGAAASYNRMKSAALTKGVVSGNELENAQRLMEAEQARVNAYRETENAALAQVKALSENATATREAVSSVQTSQNYLKIIAPFEGVITERNAHPGTLAGPSGSQPVLRLQQISRLRLLVSVPESEVASIKAGALVNFTVPSFPGETFAGKVARLGNAVDPKTRTMPVELDVNNAARRLAPGMFPQVIWPATRPRPSLLVPPSAVAVTTERTFVIRIRDGVTEWMDVKRGTSTNQQGVDLVEIFGDLAPGDQVAVRGTDELRAGVRVKANPLPPPAQNK